MKSRLPETKLEAFVWGIIVGIATCVLAVRGHAQASMAKGADYGGPFHTVVVTDSARSTLEAEWDERNPNQVERGYCIMPSDVAIDTSRDRSAVDVTLFRVTRPTDTTDATPYAVSFHCPTGYIGTIHTHTPTTCKRGDRLGNKTSLCIIGGSEAYVCNVDEWDRIDAYREHEFLTGVQCDKHAVVWYFRGKRG